MTFFMKIFEILNWVFFPTKLIDRLYYAFFHEHFRHSIPWHVFTNIFDIFSRNIFDMIWYDFFHENFRNFKLSFFSTKLIDRLYYAFFHEHFRHSILWHVFTNVFDIFSRKFSTCYSMTFFMKIFEILNWVFFPPN